MLKTLIATSLLSIGLVACQAAETAPDIRVDTASYRAPLPGQSTGVVYFDLINEGGADTLLSARANISERVELHDHLHEGGVMKMRKVDSVTIPANDTVSFASGGLHIMLFDASDEEPVVLTLDFEHHEDITIQLIANIN